MSPDPTSNVTSSGNDLGRGSTGAVAARQIETAFAMYEALSAIDAMPYYLGPIPPEQVEGLRARYHQALDLAHAALAEAESR